jgi:hypothetical protein
MIANQWFDRHPIVEALETRCHIVSYEPAVGMLHERARGMPGVERAVWDFVDAAIHEGRVHKMAHEGQLVEEPFKVDPRCLVMEGD